MKKRILILGLLIEIFLINLASAGFTLAPGNKSYDITANYASSEPIKGWLNISFQNENANSLLTAFDSSISLKDFLYNNSINCESSSICSCFPSDCKDGYSATNSQTSKQISLGYLENKIIGLKITNKIDSVSILRFNVSTNNWESCVNPLKIDLLDDGSFEWKAKNMSDDFNCIVPNSHGCFKAGDSGEQTEISEDSLYCEKIKIPVNRKLRIGANVIGSGDVQFEMSIETTADFKTCTALVSTSGEAKCEIIFDEERPSLEEANVCITKISGTAKYEIKYEDNNVCGYSDVNGEQFPHDFDIFIEAAKYDNINNFQFNQQEIYGESGTDLADYIMTEVSRYTDCNPECIIPIKIYSGINQDIVISDLYFRYYSNGIPKETSSIYDIESSDVLISSNFSKLDLAKANLLVPSSYGNKTISLKLNGEAILEKSIKILAVPKIIDILPDEVPAFVPYPFIVFLDTETSNLTYTWDFGDNTTKQTTTGKTLEHMYSGIGDYVLTVTVGNKYGNSSKTVNVKVGSPKDYVNSTINDYNKKLGFIEAEINKLPEWIKNEIKKEYDIDSIKSQINAQKSKYEDAFSDEDYTRIMKALVALDIPDSFNLSQKIAPSNIFPDSEQINLAALESFGAGKPYGTEEEYTNAVTYWFMNALQMTIESKTYALYYKNEVKDLLSYAKITLTPKENQKLGVVYFLVNGNPDEIKFNTDKTVKEYDDAAGVIFPELETPETLEFLYPGKILVGNFPVYISPEFKNLEIGVDPGICNFNKRCEKDLKEDYKNCRSDCKPIGLTILWICILLFIALCIYIALQEWYKRHYERHLFSDRNQLFNLINFMNISYNQGMKKSDIFGKLKDLGWNSEQLRYAWNKFRGKRTGMWEIPIFKWVEKRQVKRELEKRGSLSKPPQQVFRQV